MTRMATVKKTDLKTIMIFLDHGLGVAYFFDTELAHLLTRQGVRLVFLLQDELLPKLRQRYKNNDRIVFESMREKEALEYQRGYKGGLQEVMDYLRGAVASPRIPLSYVDTHRRRKQFEARGRWKFVLGTATPLIWMMRRSKILRKLFRQTQRMLFTPYIYGDLFAKYHPDLALSCMAGWRIDRYFLREANRSKLKTAAIIIGWDNPSSHGMQGADVEWINVWSEVHKQELVRGVDWDPKKVFIGGMPLYDGYLSHKWDLNRNDYFKLNGLDPKKKLISFAATALSLTPNLHIVRDLVAMVARKEFSEPTQLLLRLHPNHFKPVARYQEEAAEIIKLAAACKDVHVVEPRVLADGLPRYSGEDYPEKASMFACSDVLVTIYSTMVVEAAIYDTPVVSACVDEGHGWKDYYWIPLREIPTWPTAARVVATGAGRSAFTRQELHDVIDAYLKDPLKDFKNRRNFLKQELTYLHGESTGKTAEFLLGLVKGRE
jgi:hypothetical protein